MSQIRLSRRAVLQTATAALALAGLPVIADDMAVEIENMQPGQYTWHPERAPSGPVAVVVSLPEQRVHVYRNGVRIAVSTCSTGKPGHETPTGVFTILEKDKDHHSSTYNDAAMPNMNRLTWDGVALHAGKLPGYPASHGCVRLPMAFSEKLFGVTHVGTPVIIAGSASDSWDLTHPGMVLGNLAEGEMATAVAGLKGKAAPSDWSNGAEYPVVTVLATGEDRRLSLMENGEEILVGEMTLTGDGPLGEHVFVLIEPAEGGGLRWSGITHHPDPNQPTQPEEQVLHRIGASPDFARAMSARLHPGFTFIVSDLASTPDRKSGEDFVIMTTASAAPTPASGELRPPHRPGDTVSNG